MKITKAHRYTAIVGVVGLAITVFVVFVHQNVVNRYRQNISLVQLSNDVQQQVAVGHSHLEELISGSAELQFERDVKRQFTDARDALQSAYDGTNPALKPFKKSRNEEMLALLKQSIIAIDKLSEAANARWTNRFQADSTASADTQFAQVESTLQRLTNRINSEIESDFDYINFLSWSSITLLGLSIVMMGIWVYRRQHKADREVTRLNTELQEEAGRVGTLSTFIEAVSAGNYDIELNASSEDNLTGTLINMRDKLKKNSEEDRQRNWATSGMAQIGEILRTATSTTSELYDNIIKFIVKYTRSNQGGLFILNDEDESNLSLDLVGCYAFERKKFLTKKIPVGNGLVGQCFLEGETIYMLEVPNEYVNITSGLGGTNPNALLLVPLKVNDKVYGVLELASFSKYHDFERELVEKLAESIASTISSVKVNETTRILLEKTQQQAEDMKSQEEEIRQNMEELEATQEEMRRKQTILEKELQQSQQQADALRAEEKKLRDAQHTLQAIVDNIPRAIFWKDKDLRFIGCNRIFAKIAGASSHHELIGKTDFDMAWSAQAEAYRRDDMEVMKRKKPKLDIEEVNVNSNGEESWVLTSKVPIMDEKSEVVAILGMFEDITDRKKEEAETAKKLKEREQALAELQQLRLMIQAGKVS